MAGFGRFKLTDALPDQPPADQDCTICGGLARRFTRRQGEGQRQEEGQAGA